MSKQEIKEEFRQTEGDPAVKAKIRQIRQERAKQPHDGGGARGHRGDHEPDPLSPWR